jgi:hypothetical protein
MPVIINGSAITPAPNVTYTKNFIRTEGNGIIGVSYDIQLAGTIIAYKGNPEPTGLSPNSVYTSYSTTDDPISAITDSSLLSTIMAKQAALRSLVSTSPVILAITGFDGGSGINTNCEITNIAFDDESLWTNRCGYNISLVTPSIGEIEFAYSISEASEEWGISESDAYTATPTNIQDQKKIYTITHSVSAVGQRVNGGSAFDQAKGYVTSVIGLGSTNLPESLFPIVASYTIYNNKVTETSNVLTGSYSIQEEFTLGLSLQPATESVSISVDTDTSSFTRVAIQGTINGFNLEEYDSASVDKYANALSYWKAIEPALYTRVNDFFNATCPLNENPLSKSVSHNITEGVITYNISYDNRLANLISGAINEEIQISDTYPGQIINVVPVIGGSQPVLQYVNSRSEYKRSLNISVNMPISNCLLTKPSLVDLAAIFELYKPVSDQIYYTPPSENWNPKTGQYSYSIEWIYKGPSTYNAY